MDIVNELVEKVLNENKASSIYLDNCVYYEEDVKLMLLQVAKHQRSLDIALIKSFLSEHYLTYGKYTKANGDTGYKTFDDLDEFFNVNEE